MPRSTRTSPLATTLGAVAALFVLLVAACRGGSARSETSAVLPHVDAVSGILQILDSVPIVAIDDMHGLAEEAAFYQHLLRDPRAAGRIRDVVLELGNEMYQAVADRYVAGASVPDDSVWMIFENTTQGALLTPLLPMYRDVLDAARAVNAGQPEHRRIRVLLGDPAVEWRTITRDELWEVHKRRGDRMRELARDSVVGKRRSGIVIGGGSHLWRLSRKGGPDPKWGSLSSRVFIVSVHDGFGGMAARYEPMMDSLPVPSIVPLRGTILADILLEDAARATPAPGASPDTAPIPSAPEGMLRADSGRTLADREDALLYLGPIRTFTAQRVDMERIRRDPALMRELDRRTCLMFGRGNDTASMFQVPPSSRYFPEGVREEQVRYDPASLPPTRLPPLPEKLPPPCDQLLARPLR